MIIGRVGLLLVYLLLPFLGNSFAIPKSEDLHISQEEDFFKLGLKTFKEKKYNQSYYYWHYLVKKYPTKAIYSFNLGNIYFVQDKFDKAIITYKNVIELGSSLQEVAAIYIAKSYYGKGSIITSKRVYKRILRTPKLRPSLKQLILDDLIKINEKEKAREKEEALKVPIEYPIGLKFFKQQQYKSALMNLELASKSYVTPELFLIKGISYLKLNKPYRAKRDLRKAAKLSDDPDVIHNANLLLRLIEKKKENESNKLPSDFTMYTDISINNSTNPFTLNNLRNDTQSVQVSNFLEFGYKLLQSESFSLDPVYQVSYDHYLETSSGELLEHIGVLRSSYVFNNYQLGLNPHISFQELEDEPYLFKYGGMLSFTHFITRKLSVGLDYDSYKNKSQNAELSYLTGVSQLYGVNVGINNDKFSSRLNLVYGVDRFNDNEENTLSNHSFGYTASLFFYPISKLTVSTILSYLNKKYSKHTTTGFTKRLKNTSLSMGLSFEWSKKFTTYINTNVGFNNGNETSSGEVRGTSATDELFDFEEQISAGFNYNFF